MRKPVVVRPRADGDIEEIFAFLSRESPAATRRFLDAVEAVYGLLGENPAIGSMGHAETCPDLPNPLRFQPVRGFPRILVYYMDRPEVIEVVRVWDAARGLDALRIEEPRPGYHRKKGHPLQVAQVTAASRPG